MDIEIVDAYKIKFKKSDKAAGWSIHVYIPFWELDIRGIKLIKINSGWFIGMPHIRNFCHEENKLISFPAISFSNSEKIILLKQNIKTKAIAYVENLLNEEIKK